MGPYFDSHCHLQDERLAPGLDSVLDRARASGVTHFATCGCRESDWEEVLALARRHGDVIPLLGLHPWHVHEAGPDWLRRLEERLGRERAGLGECGLDFAIEDADRQAQERALRAQMALAKDLDRPLSIHCRKAWESLLVIAGEVGLPRSGALIHSYSGSAEVARQLQDLGFHLSFSCSLANPGNRRAAKALKATDPDRLLFETDAPDIAPPGVSINEPAHIQLVSQAAAQVLGMEEEVLARRVHGNAIGIFGALRNGGGLGDA